VKKTYMKSEFPSDGRIDQSGEPGRCREDESPPSARELSVIAQSVFAQNSIFLIDHYLGKEAIMNILRFANSFLKPNQPFDHLMENLARRSMAFRKLPDESGRQL